MYANRLGDSLLRLLLEDQALMPADLYPTEAYPERSPLHEQSLNLKDLRRGIHLERHNVFGRSYPRNGIVVGDPFRRGSEYGEDDSQADSLMVPVVTLHILSNQPVLKHWYLSDMGVVPYKGDNSEFWNPQNYTLHLK